ncbi:hypothetical protein DFH29DRAFT_881896 [Suillus ampliporus]|nr:hypothetical protein DFH29DRAFT_881896 [Suillus ampliporus]
MENTDRQSAVAFNMKVSSNAQPTVDGPMVKLCTEEDIIPLIHKALKDEATHIDDPLQGWDLRQVRPRAFGAGPAAALFKPEIPNHPTTRDFGVCDEEGGVEMQGDSAPYKNETHKQRGKRARRRLQRARDATTYKQKIKLANKHRAKSIPSKLLSKCLPIAGGAYVGKVLRSHGEAVQELEDLVQQGLKVVEWDGRTPHILLDKEERIIGVLAGHPKDDCWQDTVAAACTAMEDARSRCVFADDDMKHRRGAYPCLAVGVSFGGGQKIPGNLVHAKGNREALQSLLEHKAIQRIAGFGNGILYHYSPKVYELYSNTRRLLLDNQPGLKWNFQNNNQNFASGMCSITALGNYDPTKGGHLVLFDLGLIVQFPPGSTIIIPSAILRHGNVSISSGEKRLSFTQYFAGGLIRWVRYGLQTEANFKRESPELWRIARHVRHIRVQEAAGYFSKAQDLCKDLSLIALTGEEVGVILKPPGAMIPSNAHRKVRTLPAPLYIVVPEGLIAPPCSREKLKEVRAILKSPGAMIPSSARRKTLKNTLKFSTYYKAVPGGREAPYKASMTLSGHPSQAVHSPRLLRPVKGVSTPDAPAITGRSMLDGWDCRQRENHIAGTATRTYFCQKGWGDKNHVKVPATTPPRQYSPRMLRPVEGGGGAAPPNITLEYTRCTCHYWQAYARRLGLQTKGEPHFKKRDKKLPLSKRYSPRMLRPVEGGGGAAPPNITLEYTRCTCHYWQAYARRLGLQTKGEPHCRHSGQGLTSVKEGGATKMMSSPSNNPSQAVQPKNAPPCRGRRGCRPA